MSYFWPGSVSAHWGPGPVNANLGPGPVNADLGPGGCRYPRGDGLLWHGVYFGVSGGPGVIGGVFGIGSGFLVGCRSHCPGILVFVFQGFFASAN